MEKTYDFCLRCHRKLKNEKAKQLGYGKVCYEKSKVTNIKSTLFNVRRKEDGII